MKSHFINSAFPAFIPLIAMSLFSCDTDGANERTIISDSSANSAMKRDTAMPHKSMKAVVAASDSVTPNALNATQDSIGSKISIHRSKVKVADTTKGDK